MEEVLDKLYERISVPTLTKEELEERNSLLKQFFRKTKSLSDIALILEKGLEVGRELSEYFNSNNLLFFRPQRSYRNSNQERYLIGNPMPSNYLLLCDNDIVTGRTMEESANYFESLGYERQKIFGYLSLGYQNHGEMDIPILEQVDILLRSLKKKPTWGV